MLLTSGETPMHAWLDLFNSALSAVCAGKYEDLLKAGIIDPTKVVRCSLENAASVARTFLTSDVVVTDIPEAEPAGAGAAGGMDSMGGY